MKAPAAKTGLPVSKFRKMGIPFLGEVAWGTHFCLFYETKSELLDILPQYFTTGLEGNEFCV